MYEGSPMYTAYAIEAIACKVCETQGLLNEDSHFTPLDKTLPLYFHVQLEGVRSAGKAKPAPRSTGFADSEASPAPLVSSLGVCEEVRMVRHGSFL